MRIIGPSEEMKIVQDNGQAWADRALDYFDHLPHDRVEHSLDLLTAKVE